MDKSEEKVDDSWMRAQLRKQARKVYIQSIAAGALLTLVIALIPNWR